MATTDPIQSAVETVVQDVPADVQDVKSEIAALESGNTSRIASETTHAAGDFYHQYQTISPLVAPIVQEAKAGYKTTEFWLTLVFTILTQLQVLHLPGKWGDTVATIAAIVGYIISRGVAKAGAPNQVVPKL